MIGLMNQVGFFERLIWASPMIMIVALAVIALVVRAIYRCHHKWHLIERQDVYANDVVIGFMTMHRCEICGDEKRIETITNKLSKNTIKAAIGKYPVILGMIVIFAFILSIIVIVRIF